jgi:hypothetical protein
MATRETAVLVRVNTPQKHRNLVFVECSPWRCSLALGGYQSTGPVYHPWNCGGLCFMSLGVRCRGLMARGPD